MTTGRAIGFEGLVRPTGGAPFSDASALFGAAEAADRTVELDLACLETVAAGARLPDADAYLSVNLSPRTLESNQFQVGELKAIFQRNGIPLDRVVLELTEREQVEDLEQLRMNVDACRRAGMRLAADDVGAGNAGLRLLSEIHFDIVKIDLSLVQGGVDARPVACRPAGAPGTRRAVEGVDRRRGRRDGRPAAVVRSLGITAGQGYLLGRPASTMTRRPSISPAGGSAEPDLAMLAMGAELAARNRRTRRPPHGVRRPAAPTP